MDDDRAQQLAALGEEIGQPRPRPAVWFGAHGPDVVYLQERLEAAGLYSVEHGDEPGTFSRMTERAVLAFRQAHDLPNTAIVDDAVWVALRG